jgi:hypothetical protein
MARAKRVALRAYSGLGWVLFGLLALVSGAMCLAILVGIVGELTTAGLWVPLLLVAMPLLILFLIGKLIMAEQDARDAARAAARAAAREQ